MNRLILTAAIALIALPAAAQHAGHGAPGPAPAAQDSASTREFIAANDRMHRDMAIAFTGNADRDFAAGMIPHHQGAIDMAQVLLEHGEDPEMIKLAGEIIAAQVGEMEEMTAWLAENAK